MATEKQKRFIDIYIESYRNKDSKSLYDMLLEAGYSKATAKQGRKILGNEDSAIKQELKPISDLMKRKRRQAINAISRTKVNKAGIRDLVDIIDKFTKNIQLLDDKPTENIKLYDYDQIKRAASEIIGGGGER